jgi:hypothetical protein
MKQIRTYILLLSICTFSQQVMAQADARREARAVFSKYEIDPVFSFKAVIKMYPYGKPDKLIDKVNAEYVLQKDQYYCRIANVEIIHNKEENFVIDHDDKVVLARKYKPRQQDKKEDAAYSLPSLFAHIQEDSIQLEVVPKGQLRQLSITGISDPRILKYQLIYDPATYLVQQLLIEMQPEDNRYGKGNIMVEINYHQYDKTPKPSAFFSGKKYLSNEGRKATLQPAFKSYQLVNQP